MIWEHVFSPHASAPFFSLKTFWPIFILPVTWDCGSSLLWYSPCSPCLKVWQLQKNPVTGHTFQQLALKLWKTIQERKLLNLCPHQGNRQHGKGMSTERAKGWKRGREKNQWKEEKKVEKAARPFIDIKIQALKNQRKSEIKKLDHYKKHLRYESAGDTCTDCVELTSIGSQEGEDLVELGHYRSTGSSKKMHSICSRQTPDVWFLIVD